VTKHIFVLPQELFFRTARFFFLPQEFFFVPQYFFLKKKIVKKTKQKNFLPARKQKCRYIKK